jgi:hypothetical protein
MAICKTCGGEMTQGISCSPTVRIKIGGVDYRPIRWTDEPEWRYEHITFQCGDCATPPGGVHHPGCCVERCPACLGQSLGCECNDDPLEGIEAIDDIDDIDEWRSIGSRDPS